MCDYSLIGIPNRLANEGEELVVHRFPIGSMGLVPSQPASQETGAGQASERGLWQRIKDLFRTDSFDRYTAVCVPPGARLLLRDIPGETQKVLRIGPEEEVTFTQLTAEANAYRDAIRFDSGTELLLQKLREGQRIRILRLAADEQTPDWVERLIDSV